MKLLTRLLLVAGLAFTAACATTDYGPARYSPDMLGQLQPGDTTLVEAKELFGNPTADMAVDGGGRLLQWQVRKQQAVPGAPDSHLALLFDADGTLVKIQRATRR